MDLIIKNLESLKYFENKPQPKAITIDIKKVIEDSVEFSETFEKSCEKYKELERTCQNCEYFEIESDKEPCRSCWESLENRPNWKPTEPSLKEVTERMQSEFDATGKDVKIFMNERVIKK